MNADHKYFLYVAGECVASFKFRVDAKLFVNHVQPAYVLEQDVHFKDAYGCRVAALLEE